MHINCVISHSHDPAPGPVTGSSTSRIDARSRTEIERAVAHVFTVAMPDLARARRGKAPVALARQVAMYLTHVGVGLSLTDVGRLFARDRTTVAHACAVVEDRRDEPAFDCALQCLEGVVTHLVQLCGCPRASSSAAPD